MSCGMQAPLLAMDRRGASHIMVEGGEAKNLDVREHFQKESHKESSVSARSPTTLSTPILILPLSSSSSLAIFFLFPPSSPLPSLLSVAALSMVGVSDCFMLLGSFLSPLSLFQSLGWRSLQSIDYSHISTKSELVVRQAEELTWLGLIEFEKSNLQLSSIFSKGQKYFDGVQLACNFSRWQEYFDGSQGWLMSDKYLGFSFEENGPSLLLQLDLKRSQYISDRLLQN